MENKNHVHMNSLRTTQQILKLLRINDYFIDIGKID